MKPATIYDIAARARVSPVTVSLALRAPTGRSRMRASTRARILRLAQRLNYRTNAIARGLKSGRTFLVGLYVNRADYFSMTEPHWHTFVSGLQSRLLEAGYRLAFFYFEPGQETRVEEFLIPGRFVDAIVVQGRNLSAGEIRQIRASGMKVVSLYEELGGVHSLTIDEFGTGAAAAEYLYRRGHRRAAIIARRNQVERWAGRVHGFLRRAAELGLIVPKTMQFFSEEEEVLGAEAIIARRLFHRLLKRRADTRCLYVPSDLFAFPIVEEIDQHGWSLGKDFSLLSYDDLEGLGRLPWGQPRLTTFAPPHAAMAAAAARILGGSSAPNEPFHQTFQPRLVERTSVVQLNGKPSAMD